MLFAPTLAFLAALLVAGPALSALRGGTNGVDNLIGTTSNDQLTGLGDADILKGLAGNDLYYFADNWSKRASDGAVLFDTLVETSGQGSDTVSFRGVTTGGVTVRLEREWAATFGHKATGPGGDVRFSYSNVGTVAQSFVEKAIGGQGNFDWVSGGAGPNTIQPGGGTSDRLRDFGGWKAGAEGLPGIPVSNDIFKGLADTSGTITVMDWGGTGDTLDLRPFSTENVYIAPIDQDGSPTSLESLQIVTGPSTQVIVYGHFGDYFGATNLNGHKGRIENLIFADTTITNMSTLQANAASAEDLSAQQADLAAAAPRLAEEARALVDPSDLTGAKLTQGGDSPGAEVGPDAGKDTDRGTADTGKQQDKDDKAKKDKKDKNEKKQDKKAKAKKHDRNEKKHDQRHDKKAKQNKQGKRHGLQRWTDRAD
jgi:hypothetical protein